MFFLAALSFMPEYQTIALGFSTADGERPELQFAGGDLQCSFVDWREQMVRFTASDTRAFSWLEELDVDGIRDDATYEVLESDWIQKYCVWHRISRAEGYRHFKLCFNPVGVLDILCKAIVVTSSGSTENPAPAS